MSSTARDMIIKPITDDVCTRRLLKGKYGDQFDLLRANPSSIHVSRWSCGGSGCGRVIWCQDSRMKANGFSNSKPKRHEPPLMRCQAILAPVWDPAPTTKKKIAAGQSLLNFVLPVGLKPAAK